MSKPPHLPESVQTVREALRAALREGPRTIHELSVAVGAKEKDLLDHLVHVERSLARSGERFVVEPARCLSCSYEFGDRTRRTRPGRCPACRGSRIAHPRFSIEADGTER